MKKLISLLIILIMCIPFSACTPPSATSSSTSSSRKTELSDSQIESIVSSELYSEISKWYKTADPGSCRYSINKTEKKNNQLYVYGTVTLYDKYGSLTTGHSDGSGRSFRTFTIEMRSNGDVISCDID